MKTLRARVNVSFEILPFGQSHIVMRGTEETKQTTLKQPVTYGEPNTTNQQPVEISFGGEEYKAPKSTGGSL